MSKFTKGPWKIDKYGAIVDSTGNTVRVKASIALPLGCGSAEAKANAHLIAAAPKLYHTVEMLTDALESLAGECPEVEKGRATLAKAEGKL